MDEKYYRDAINAVMRNEKGMWGQYDADSNEGFDDFAKLWEIVNDENAEVTPPTYFEAIDICQSSFFGTIQNPVPVWSNVLNHYKAALGNDDNEFIRELVKFLNQNYNSIQDSTNFYQFIHLAIESEDIDMVRLIFNHASIEVECWDLLREMYSQHPEMAAYYEIFGDLTYDWLPENETEFRDTIGILYTHFGSIPEMEKLREYYHRYC